MKTASKYSVVVMFAIVLATLMGCASTATKEGTGGYFDDSTITAKVKTELMNTPNIDSTEITVETFKGVVKLSGYLDSMTMIDAAVKAAKSVDGVKSVDNALTVKGQQGS
jgi:osmotically-inducible protein OsmY